MRVGHECVSAMCASQGTSVGFECNPNHKCGFKVGNSALEKKVHIREEKFTRRRV